MNHFLHNIVLLCCSGILCLLSHLKANTYVNRLINVIHFIVSYSERAKGKVVPKPFERINQQVVLEMGKGEQCSFHVLCCFQSVNSDCTAS